MFCECETSGVHRFMSDFKGLQSSCEEILEKKAEIKSFSKVKKVTYSSFKFCMSRIVVFRFDQTAAAERSSLSMLCFCFRIRSSSSADSDSLIPLSLKEHR